MEILLIMTKEPDYGPIGLSSDSLFSKWGFDDGDVLNYHPLFDEWDDNHPALIAIVKRFLLPHIKDNYELEVDLHTCHNPIRIKSFNGLDVSPLWYVSGVLLPLAETVIVIPAFIAYKYVKDGAVSLHAQNYGPSKK